MARETEKERTLLNQFAILSKISSRNNKRRGGRCKKKRQEDLKQRYFTWKQAIPYNCNTIAQNTHHAVCTLNMQACSLDRELK